jgi:hypothetical protein
VIELVASLVLRPRPHLILSRILEQKLDLNPPIVKRFRLLIRRTEHRRSDEDDAVCVGAECDVGVATVEDDGGGGVDGDGTAKGFDENVAVCKEKGESASEGTGREDKEGVPRSRGRLGKSKLKSAVCSTREAFVAVVESSGPNDCATASSATKATCFARRGMWKLP